MNNTKELLVKVKAAGEDFEWYPTTDEILQTIARDMNDRFYNGVSILDVGAGDGQALEKLHKLSGRHGDSYAIEVSPLLVSAMPKDIFVVGTDFHQQTLIDKQVDVLFCNPPYSEYEAWTSRIVREANAQVVYLVIPKRWRQNEVILAELRRRAQGDRNPRPTDLDNVISSLGEFSFQHSEHRQARAEVEIVRFDLTYGSSRHGSSTLKTDPFDLWFTDTFKINADVDTRSDFADNEIKKESLHDLVIGHNLVERLEELYNAAFTKLLGIYRQLETLPHELFKELGADLSGIKGGLKAKIKGLKVLYWQEFFNNLGEVTRRLTSASRKRMMERLMRHTSVDFTANNAYAVLQWVIKNANSYYDDQIKEVYYQLTEQENIHNFKSNERIYTDRWRFNRENPFTHYTLDYRLVLNRYRCFYSAEHLDSHFDYPNGLSISIHDFLNDIVTLAENFGYKVPWSTRDVEWEPGKRVEAFYEDGKLFMDVKAFKKGTIHIRLDQEFMKRLNVEAARLNGWIKSPQEAEEEFGYSDGFGETYKVTKMPLLLGS